MKRITLLLALFLFTQQIRAQLQVSYYIVGDADDWQLFMSNKLISDLDAGGKVVVITLTAGDEGNGPGMFNGSTTPYYQAKEKGAVYSSKFVADFMNTPYPLTYGVPSSQVVSINSKNLVKYVYGNSNGVGSVVNYFLRLPDGGQTGAGYAGTGNNSLKKLKDGNIASLTSIDGQNTYTWSQLVNTIYAIIFAEKGADPQVWINVAELNTANNPNDHSDHTYSSMAAQEAVATRLWVGINDYVMNYSSNLADNNTNEEYEDATAAYTMYDWNLIKEKYASQFNSTTRAWLNKEYSAIERNPTGNGPLPITLLSFTGTLKGNNVLLEWTTSSEINSKEFQLERSSDGVTYRRIGTIAAAGTSSVNKNYKYLDVEATELNYYRLKSVDIDGYSKLSDVVIVKNNGLSQAVYPAVNPFSDYIGVRFAKMPKGQVTVRVMDMSGKLVSTTKVYNPLSSVIRVENTSALSQGLYMVQVENEGRLYGVKMLKQ
ncbi:MAG TPA: T9SS type A sorting domain-containing protein [Ferruginibacter sp.]|nr:hypothetical protein [Chitinophagaceae bacterium]HRI24407.1 T9SS type A sorting domain-containing protein [Ferruginibacter sp.]